MTLQELEEIRVDELRFAEDTLTNIVSSVLSILSVDYSVLASSLGICVIKHDKGGQHCIVNIKAATGKDFEETPIGSIEINFKEILYLPEINRLLSHNLFVNTCKRTLVLLNKRYIQQNDIK